MVARLRLAVRLAGRDARRALGRSVLVVIMVAVPVAAVVATWTLARTDDVSPAEALPGRIGQADALVATYPFQAEGGVYADPRTGRVLGPRAAEESSDPLAEPEVRPVDVTQARAEVLGLLDDVDRSVVLVRGQAPVDRGDGVDRQVSLVVGDLADPMLDGLVRVEEGRLPTGPDEVALTAALSRTSGSVGDVLRVGADGGREVAVVGVVDLVDGPVDRTVLAPPEADDLLLPGGDVDTATTVEVYVDVPGDVGLVQALRLNEAGYPVLSRALAEDPPPQEGWAPPDSTDPTLSTSASEYVGLTLIAALVLLEVVLLAGPAFAVGARRQERDLALLAATGAAPADLRRVVLAQGALLGALAAVVGGAAGLALAWATTATLRRRDLLPGPFDPDPRVVVGVVVLGAVAGLAAAWLPARRVVRRPVVAALAGRRGQSRTGWGFPVAGAVLASVGVVLLVLGVQGLEVGVALGAVAVVLGVVLATGALIGAAGRLAPRLRRTPRLVVRDLARNRARSAPAVAAVLGAVATATVLGVGIDSLDAESRRLYVPDAAEGGAVVRAAEDAADWAAVEALLGEVEPGRPAFRVDVPAAPDGRPAAVCLLDPGGCVLQPVRGSWSSEVAVVDPDAALLLDPEVPEEALAALRDDRAVTFADGPADEVAVGLVAEDLALDPNAPVLDEVALPALRVPADRLAVPALVLVPPSLADRLPHGTTTAAVVLGPGGDPLGAEDGERLEQELAAVLDAAVAVETGPPDPIGAARLLLTGLAGVLALVAGLAGGRLALVEAEPDLRVLHQVGASPGLRRGFTVGSASAVTVLGALLGALVGLPVGLTAALALTGQGESGLGAVVEVPWGLLALLVVGLPALVAALAAATTRTPRT